MELITMRELFKNTAKYADQEIEVGGWVRNRRGSKQFGFIMLSDGTYFNPIQVVYNDSIENFQEISKINIGAALIIKGTVVIDCAGDGDVACRSGVPYEMGNEELNLMQPATMFFHISNVDLDAVEADIQANIHNFYRKDGVNYRSFHWRVTQARENVDWNLKRVSIGLFRMPKPDEWCVNTSRIMGVDSTDNESLTNAEIVGRQKAQEILHFLQKYVPGC